MWNASLIDAPVPVPGEPEGYRLNLPEALMTQDLEAFRVTPQPPVRVLFGEPTAFLRFADEAAALACAGLAAFLSTEQS